VNVLEEVSLLKQENKLKDAEKKIREALKQNESDPQLWNSLGVILADMGRYEEAVEAYQQAITLKPDFAICYNNLSVAYKRLRKFDSAKFALEKALEIDPQLAEALNNLANYYRDIKDFQKARELYEKAYIIKPDMMEIATNLAIVYSDMGELKKALELLKKILTENPYNHTARKILSTTLFKLGRFEEAEFNLRFILTKSPNDYEAYALLGGILTMTDPPYPKEAEELLQKALQLKPDSAEVYQNLGTLYSIMGKKEDAVRCYERAHQINPENPSYIRQITSAKKLKDDDPYFQKLKEIARQDLPILAKIEVLQGLVDAYEKLGKHEQAFEYLITANKLKRSILTWSDDIVKDTVNQRINIFTKEIVQKLSGYGYPSKIPLFITGMPRSGTTLMESILDAHPDVFGAGELKLLREVLKDGIWIEGVVFTGSDEESLSKQVLKAPLGFFEIGRRYVTRIRTLASGAKRIIDKMPSNAFNIGLIALSMPWAKIIHMRRHPLDTILSCFRQPFAEGHEFTYDLKELTVYYNEYFRVMKHWREVFPDAFIDVDYEVLVLRPEETIRRVIEYVEIPYHEDCLKFYLKERPVRTASQEQVRNPIYKTSIGRWKRFEKYFAPVFETLSEEVKEEIKRVDALIASHRTIKEQGI